MSSKVNQFFKNKISSMKGSISDREMEYLRNKSSYGLSDLQKIKGSISDKEMSLLMKLLPNK